MNECRSVVLGEVIKPCFHDGAILTSNAPGSALAFLVGFAFNRLGLAGRFVVQSAGDHSILIDRELYEQRRNSARLLSIFGNSKHTQWKPFRLCWVGVRTARSDCCRLLGVLF